MKTLLTRLVFNKLILPGIMGDIRYFYNWIIYVKRILLIATSKILGKTFCNSSCGFCSCV